jgi:phage tail P2-like protein
VDLSDVSIIPLLPPNLANDKNVRAMCQAFDSELRRLVAAIPGIEIIPNIARKRITDDLLLDLLAWQFHCDFYSADFSTEQKQEILLKSLDWHTRKGTPSVIEEIVSTVFSKAIVQEWFEYDGLPYRFRIATEESMHDTETRRNLIRAINSVKNTRSLFETFSQLVFLIDKVVMNEQPQMEMRTKTLVDNFSSAGRLRRNGRFRRDGTFVNTEIEGYFIDRNGKYKRDESLVRGENYRRVPSKDVISPPFLRNTWERERFLITFDYGRYEERQFAQALRNTSLQRDSGIVRDGLSDKSVTEMLRIWYKKHHFRDSGFTRDDGVLLRDSMVLIPLE